MTQAPKNRSCFSLHLVNGIFLLLLVILTGGTAKAQDADTSRLGIEPGVPAGSYPLSGFDNINMFNGNLNFTLSFMGAKGRGGAQVPLSLSLEQHWKVKQTTDFYENPIYYPDTDWGVEWKPVFGPGYLISRSGVDGQWTPCYYGNWNGNYSSVLTRLTFIAPDGTEYQLHDTQTGGQPYTYGQCAVTGNSRGTEFVTADGTSATFISDAAIREMTLGGEDAPSGYLMLRDGTRYRIQDGFIQWMRDRNGNRIVFKYSNGTTGNLTKITDSLNREITIEYNVNESAPYGSCTRITYKGFGGAPRIIRISWTSMSNALRSGSSIQTYAQLFPDLNGSGTTNFNPTKVSALWMPDGRSYQFKYNSYGELARVDLPTGGATEYDWAAGMTGTTASGTLDTGSNDKVVYRRVVERRLYADGVNLTNRMTVSRPESFDGNHAGYVDSETQDGAGHWLNKDRHYFYGLGFEAFGTSGASYSTWKYGKEYKTEVLDSSGAVLRRVENTWQQRASVSWWIGSSDNAPPNDPRMAQTVTTIEPAGANLVSKQIFGYDDSVPFNNQNNLKEYGFGSGVPGSLVRETRTTYVTATDYVGASGAHLRSLPAQTSVYDAGPVPVERARTTFEYDNYTADGGNHAALLPRSSISGLDAAFTASYTSRGNATATTSYLLNTGGSVIGSVTSYAHYDIAGNVVKAIDGRGNPTDIYYDDCFGAPDDNATTSTAPVELSSVGQASYAFPTAVTNAANQTVRSQFDYYLGRPVNTQDANGIVSSGSYEDALDRPTQVIRAANNSAAKNQTLFVYDDSGHTITTKTDQTNFDDKLLKTELVYDGLGRTTETRQYENATNYIAVKKVPFVVLQDGSNWLTASQSSNPFRVDLNHPELSEQPVWTTSFSDSLGRVVKVKTPDNALVSTAYSGNRVLVIDQAGKERISLTDGLGRLKDVWEVRSADPPATENLSFPGHTEVAAGYRTSYAYDTLDNLTTVTQGSQTRSFVYDTLKRLSSAGSGVIVCC